MQQQVAAFFADHPRITVPRPVRALSRRRVLTSTFVEGERITLALDRWRAQRDAGDTVAGARLDEMLGLVLEAYTRQVLEAGVFQADPHPGNLLVTDDGRLVLLDFGCARDPCRRWRGATTRRCSSRFSPATPRVSRRCWAKWASARRAAAPTRCCTSPKPCSARFARRALAGGGVPWLDRDAAGRAGARCCSKQRSDDPVVRIPDEFAMLARVFGSLGGLFQHYRPRLDWARHMQPVLAAFAAI